MCGTCASIAHFFSALLLPSLSFDFIQFSLFSFHSFVFSRQSFVGCPFPIAYTSSHLLLLFAKFYGLSGVLQWLLNVSIQPNRTKRTVYTIHTYIYMDRDPCVQRAFKFQTIFCGFFFSLSLHTFLHNIYVSRQRFLLLHVVVVGFCCRREERLRYLGLAFIVMWTTFFLFATDHQHDIGLYSMFFFFKIDRILYNI